MMTRSEKNSRRVCATHISSAGAAGGMERAGAVLLRELPVFEGYTVDDRLEEFRKLERGMLPEFVPFSSAKGVRLLRRYRASAEARE